MLGAVSDRVSGLRLVMLCSGGIACDLNMAAPLFCFSPHQSSFPFVLNTLIKMCFSFNEYETDREVLLVVYLVRLSSFILIDFLLSSSLFLG